MLHSFGLFGLLLLMLDMIYHFDYSEAEGDETLSLEDKEKQQKTEEKRHQSSLRIPRRYKTNIECQNLVKPLLTLMFVYGKTHAENG